MDERMTDYIKREDAYSVLTDYYNHRTVIQHASHGCPCPMPTERMVKKNDKC